MILCIDSGNSRIKFGLWNGADWCRSGSCPQADLVALGDVRAAWPMPRRIMLANVAGAAAEVRIRAALGDWAGRLEVVRSTAQAGGVRNGYVYKILNKVREDRVYVLTTQGIPGATIDVVGGDANIAQTELAVDKDSVGTFRLFVTAPDSALKGARQPVTFVLTEKATGAVVRNESMFAAPDR